MNEIICFLFFAIFLIVLGSLLVQTQTSSNTLVLMGGFSMLSSVILLFYMIRLLKKQAMKNVYLIACMIIFGLSSGTLSASDQLHQSSFSWMLGACTTGTGITGCIWMLLGLLNYHKIKPFDSLTL